MSGSGTAANASVGQPTLPGQRRSSGAARAATGHQAVREAWVVLRQRVAGLGDDDFAGPSKLPGWTRGHVVSHLARNADALVNLLTWARTGIEHAAYASRADRDADIEAGADRLPQVIREDLYAACDRFHTAITRLGDSDWDNKIMHPSGRWFPAAEVPELALFEAWNHMVDLDAGVTFDDVPVAHLDRLLDLAVRPHRARTDGESLRLAANLPDGRQRTWELAIATPSSSRELSGSSTAVLGWLTGRGDGTDLVGTPPELAAWG
ncbi:maleylpyruvate isomerase [Actinokineospora iranica]|uniref:Maleylpyruvate isomerase n=1 Tax=Actinokineospora iranica TaxID=1271860 RepID=A0A1G6JD78_9PSEU|nr:maleylpyruvate isomerase [Actinokineospora iranica]